MQSSPSAAKAVGDLYYYTGVPCRHGHVSQRFASTRACVDCLETAKKSYRAQPENKEKAAAAHRQYRLENAEQLRLRRMEKYVADPAPFLAASRGWKERNSEKVRAYCSEYKRSKPGDNAARAAKYTCSKRAATPPWADLEAIKQVYIVAADLTTRTGIPHEVDHIHPLNGTNSCGIHVAYNLRAIPAKMNRIKYNKAPDDIQGYAKLAADRVKK